MKSPSKKFLQSILSDKRYWFLLILFCALFIVGKKVGEPRGPEQPFRRPAFLERDSAIVINTAQGGYVVQNALSTLPGNSYRIIFSAAMNEDPRRSSSDLELDGQDGLEVMLQSLGGKQLSIGKVLLEKYDSWQTYELIFTADDYYNTIFFKKDISINTKDILVASIEVDSLSTTALGIENVSYFGDTEIVPSEDDIDLNIREVIMSFYKKPIQFVQPFVAQSEKFYGVDIAMKFFGNGGDGNYTLQLVTFNKLNEVSHVLTSTNFNVGAESSHQIKPSVYRFPISANLKIGKKYGIRISNEAVRVSFIHHLQIYGTTSEPSETNSAFSTRNNKNQTLKAKGAMRPIYANLNKIDGDNLLVDSRIRSIDQDIAIFNYISANKDESILDIFEANTSVYLDKAQRAFVAKLDDSELVDSYFIIKVATVLPINSLNIFADQYEASNVQYSRLEYSFDQVNWFALDSFKDEFTNSYNATIKPGQKTNVIYFKVSPAEITRNSERFSHFGISKLSISALLERK